MTQSDYIREYYVREYCFFYAKEIWVTELVAKTGKKKQYSFARLPEEQQEKWIKEWSNRNTKGDW